MIRAATPLFWSVLAFFTLALGGLALTLLWREAQRVEVVAREGAEARGRTVAENLALLVQEVKSGILQSLAALPEDGLEEALTRWRESAAFVETAFLWSDREGVRVPGLPDEAAARAEQALRQTLGGGSPAVSDAAPTPAPESPGAREGSALAVSLQRTLSQREAIRERIQTAPQEMAADKASAPVPERLDRDAAEPPASFSSGRAEAGSVQADPRPSASVRLGATRPVPASFAPAERGWDFRLFAGAGTWIGWHRPPGSARIRGVVLSRPELEREFVKALPESSEGTPQFVLLDPAGQRVGAEGEPAAPDPADGLAIGLGSELPGWRLLVVPGQAEGFGPAFLWVGGALTTTLMIALFAGGTVIVRQARREARDAARRTTFVTNVSHELKSPLTTIRMYAELLGENRITDREKRSAYLSTIVAECDRLTRLVKNVLDFSSLEKERAGRSTSFDAGAILRRILETYRPGLEKAGLTPEVSLPEDPVPAQGDPDALEQALVNLLDNAVKYAGGGGWVGVSLQASPGGVVIAVADRGPGIPESQRDRIFESFQRGDHSLTAKVSGTGLGLHIARRLLRRSGGDLLLEPDSDGTGARFKIHLPGGAP